MSAEGFLFVHDNAIFELLLLCFREVQRRFPAFELNQSGTIGVVIWEVALAHWSFSSIQTGM